MNKIIFGPDGATLVGRIEVTTENLRDVVVQLAKAGNIVAALDILAAAIASVAVVGARAPLPVDTSADAEPPKV
jgi:hypothetical protein